MGNQNTSSFQKMKSLPVPLVYSQCVLHKHELLICGDADERACYSYHTLKNEYKFICEYPDDVKLEGHCVVKLVDSKDKDSNEITLLSFGGENKHTLVMKYISVWSDDNDNINGNEKNKSKKLKKSNNYNEWVPFIDNHNRPIHIGRDGDDYKGMRALIGGNNNNLLFITYSKKNISVFDLNAFQFIKHDTLPTKDGISFHCFVSKSENGQEMTETNEEKEKKSKKRHEMLLFKYNTGLSIEYDEDNNNFQFHKLPVCNDIAPFKCYAYVCIDDVILLFGGWNGKLGSDAIYSIRENKWTVFQNILSSSLCGCVGILSEDNMYVHIIGGGNKDRIAVSKHLKMQ
ncbi:hypothetical protein RFI_05492, partial [Reticulomyxa filosa]